MEYEVIIEGTTKLKVPLGGGISKREEVFYNPNMRLTRDLTVILCRLLKPKSFLDIMAGCGARGIRVANETGVKVTLNDLNPKAIDIIKENARLNNTKVLIETHHSTGLLTGGDRWNTTERSSGVCPTKGRPHGRVRTTGLSERRPVVLHSADARVILAGGRFDYVDLDPFGTPVPFVDAVVSSLRLGGIFGVCATDTSCLCGSYPKACMRKYDAHPLRCDCYNEIGLRILLGHIARVALRRECGIEPLFSHSTRHYMRSQVKVMKKPAETLEKVSYLQYCFKCLWRDYRFLGDLGDTCCGDKLQTVGPLWSGSFANPKLCKQMERDLLYGEYKGKNESVKLTTLIGEEQEILTPYYDLHKLCGKLSLPPPKMDALKKLINNAGYRFSRTHFSDTGFRSNMPPKSLIHILKE